MKKFVTYLSIVLLTIFVTGCASSKRSQEDMPSISDNVLYKQAMNELDQGNFDAAAKDFMKLTTEFAYSSHASSAQYYEAVAKFKNNDFDGAEAAAYDYISLHPTGEFVEEAYYLRATCSFKQILPVGLNQENTLKAQESFIELINRFPNSKYTQDAKNKISFLNNHLAGQEMEVANYYMKKNNFTAAIRRYTNLLENNQESLYTEEVLYRLVEAYKNLKLDNEAKKYAAILGKNYPESKWYQKSYNLILKSN